MPDTALIILGLIHLPLLAYFIRFVIIRITIRRTAPGYRRLDLVDTTRRMRYELLGMKNYYDRRHLRAARAESYVEANFGTPITQPMLRELARWDGYICRPSISGDFKIGSFPLYFRRAERGDW